VKLEALLFNGDLKFPGCCICCIDRVEPGEIAGIFLKLLFAAVVVVRAMLRIVFALEEMKSRGSEIFKRGTTSASRCL